jgi:hypothetical protein
MPRGTSISDTAIIQGRLWTPAVLLPNFWLDASDLSTITVATGVSQWRDKRGNGVNAVQATGANQPTYSATSFFGRPGITFDGVNDGLSISTTAGQNTTHGVFWVFQRIGAGTDTGGSGYRPEISCASSVGGADNGALHYVKNTNNLGASYPYYNAPGPVTMNYDLTAGTVYSNTAGQVMSFQNNVTGWGVWRNGLLEGTTAGLATPNSTNSGYNLAVQLVPVRTSNIIIAEVLHIPISNTTNRQLVEGYLAWKWGLQTSLASTHPYINRPPLI